VGLLVRKYKKLYHSVVKPTKRQLNFFKIKPCTEVRYHKTRICVTTNDAKYEIKYASLSAQALIETVITVPNRYLTVGAGTTVARRNARDGRWESVILIVKSYDLIAALYVYTNALKSLEIHSAVVKSTGAHCHRLFATPIFGFWIVFKIVQYLHHILNDRDFMTCTGTH
jgi:hypothetical protein